MTPVRKQGVLITDGNERAALAATRALGRHGIPVYVGADSSASLAGRSRSCTMAFQYPSPWKSPREYAACILETARRTNAAVLLPMTDVAVELLGEHARELEGVVSVPIPSLAQYRQLSNKYELTAWAMRNGLPVPQTLFLPDGAVDRVLDQITEWPVIVKPGASLIKRDGRWAKTSVHVARDADELLHLYEDRWYLRQPSLIQRRIVGEGQGIFGVFAQGQPVVLFAHRRIREKPPGGGVSVLRESIPLAQPITDYAVRILRSAQWHGVAMVEFKVDRESGVPYLMEVNGRFWGSLQLAIDAGVDFPFLAYQLAATGKLEAVEQAYRVGVRSRWFLGDLDQLILRLRKSDEHLGMPPGSPTRGEALLEFIARSGAPTHSEVMRLSDPLPGLHELSGYLGGLARSVLGRARARLPDPRAAAARSGWALLDRLGLRDTWLRRHAPLTARNVLVLCKGNVCRSPFAAELLRRRARERGLNIEVASAGLEAVPDQPAHPLARRVAQQYGVSLSDHRTVLLSQNMVADADLILVMEAAQARSLEERYPQSAGKRFLLGQFGPHSSHEIADPYGASAQAFAECYDQIDKDCDRLVSFLVHAR
jgi:protein-tyrosine-phosphatase/predicted ATP-grasp superfamily ATP-dependent carboligase